MKQPDMTNKYKSDKMYYEKQGMTISDEDRYFRSSNKLANFLQCRRVLKSCELILNIIKNYDVQFWLDVGCGDGVIFNFLLKNSYKINKNQEEVVNKLKKIEIFGLDISISKLKRLKSRFPKVHAVAGDALNLPFEDGAFQLVTCFEVIEHFDKHQGIKILKEINRVLTAEDILIVSTPSYYSPREYLARKSGNLGEHKYIYKQSELKQILDRLGFRLINITSAGFMFQALTLSWKITEILLSLNNILICFEKLFDKSKILRNINWTTFVVCQKIT